MKFWQKIFLATLVLFLVVCNMCIYQVVKEVYRYNLHEARKTAIQDFEFLAEQFGSNMEALQNRKNLNERTVKSLTESYGTRYRGKDKYVAVVYNESYYLGSSDWPVPKGTDFPEFFYGNCNLKKDMPSTALQKGEKLVVIREAAGKQYICIWGDWNGKFQNSQLIYMREIEEMALQWKKLDMNIMQITIVSSACLMLVLLLLIEAFFVPLEKLTAAVRTIGKDNNENRIVIKGKNELAQLSKAFYDMAQEVSQRIHTSEQENRNKEQFIHNMSHEMRTPLTTICGYAELMKHAAMEEEERQEALDEIILESKRLLELREKLMILSTLKVEPIEKREVDVTVLFAHMERQFKLIFQARGIQWKKTIGADKVYANETLLEILLTNLIQNAIWACTPQEDRTVEEGYTPKICVESKREGENILLLVIDNGRGMSEEELKHIQEPFYRVDKARSRVEGGMGLGLALCSNIAENQEAQLRFQSKLGKGTVAILQVPNNLLEKYKN